LFNKEKSQKWSVDQYLKFEVPTAVSLEDTSHPHIWLISEKCHISQNHGKWNYL